MKKGNSFTNRIRILMEEMNEYVRYLEKRLERQDELINSLQNSLEAYGSFIKGLHITHKGTPNFGNNDIPLDEGDSDIEIINLD